MFCNGCLWLRAQSIFVAQPYIWVRIIFPGQPSTNRTEHPYAGSFILHVGPKERCDGVHTRLLFFIQIVVYFCSNYFCAGGKIKVLEIHLTSHPKKALYYYYDVCISTTSRWSVVIALSCIRRFSLDELPAAHYTFKTIYSTHVRLTGKGFEQIF